MKSRIFLGMLTPSSNTTLEPICTQMVAGLPEVTSHFGRFRVTEISLSQQALGQFDVSQQLAAADLLADAKCDVICWNGTSAGWMGFEQDYELCKAITKRTGIPACSSVLALAEVFKITGAKRFGMVSPYIDEIQTRINANFLKEGFDCVADQHAGIKVNFDFSEIDTATISRMARTVAQAKPQAITVFCTNMKGAPLAEPLEQELGIPIYDTVSLAVWASLRVCGVDTTRVKGWGRLFSEVR
jgi:maleate isomerase